MAKFRQARQAGTSPSDTPTWIFLAPLVAVLFFATAFPLIYSIYMSFFNWNWGNRFSFIGLRNYNDVFANHEYWASMWRTGFFTILAVTFETTIGFALALLVNKIGRHAGWLRSILIAPLMVSGIAVSLTWKIILDPTIGVLPRLLGHLGIDHLNLLGDPKIVLTSVAGLDTWWQTGFVFIILSAGLQALPKDPIEAAQIDGASAWKSFRYITLPLMLPLIFIVAGIRSIDCLKLFALVYGATGGGPGQSSESVQLLAYRTGFKASQMSMSMTMLVIYVFITAVAVVSVFGIARWRRRHV